MALISPQMEVLELNHQMQKWFPNVDQDQCPICFRVFNHPPREILCEYCPTTKTLQDGQVHEAQTQTPTPNGLRNYRIVSSPIFDAEGRVKAAVELVEVFDTAPALKAAKP